MVPKSFGEFTVQFYHDGKHLGQRRVRLDILARPELKKDLFGQTVISYSITDYKALRKLFAEFLEDKYRVAYAADANTLTHLIVNESYRTVNVEDVKSYATTPNVHVYLVDGHNCHRTIGSRGKPISNLSSFRPSGGLVNPPHLSAVSLQNGAQAHLLVELITVAGLCDFWPAAATGGTNIEPWHDSAWGLVPPVHALSSACIASAQ